MQISIAQVQRSLHACTHIDFLFRIQFLFFSFFFKKKVNKALFTMSIRVDAICHKSVLITEVSSPVFSSKNKKCMNSWQTAQGLAGVYEVRLEMWLAGQLIELVDEFSFGLRHPKELLYLNKNVAWRLSKIMLQKRKTIKLRLLSRTPR